MMDARLLDLVLKGGRVTRFHTKSFLKAETNAEHSFLVAWVAWWMVGGTPTANLLMAALAHDLPEYLTGDVPSPVKRQLGGVLDGVESKVFAAAGVLPYTELLEGDEPKALKFADLCAGWLKCVYEVQLGNSTLAHTRTRYAEYMGALVATMTPDMRTRAMSLIHAVEIPVAPTDYEGIFK